MKGIHLVENTIDNKDIDDLIEWLKTYPRLTKGRRTLAFEKAWSEWLGCKHSVYVNSGSSANLAMIHALKCHKKLEKRYIVVPAVSWATTVAPVIQSGFTPVLVDCDKDTLGLDITHLKKTIERVHPVAIVVTHILGFPSKMDEIKHICEKDNIIMLEDSCETVGSTYCSQKTGTFGLMSTFSFYFGHHMSTIEGGMVCTDDDDIYDTLLMIRSHGWARDLDKKKQESLRKEHGISEFDSLYTFYHSGFNIRSTDLQAFIGLRQLEKLDDICNARYGNFLHYHQQINNSFWKIPRNDYCFVSNFAYPIMHPKRDLIARELMNNGIECRPLVCGSMEKQPFCQDSCSVYGTLDNANDIHKYGMYIPNHPELTNDDLNRICNIVNGVINE